jgi:1-phosphatidylinositol-4-phosphate 5-kinase
MNGNPSNGSPSAQAVPNNRAPKPVSIDKRLSQEEAPSRRSRGDRAESESLNRFSETRTNSSDMPNRDDGYFASIHSSETRDRFGSTTHVKLGHMDPYDSTMEASKDFVPHVGLVPGAETAQSPAGDAAANLQVPSSAQRVSSPPAFNHNSPAPSQHPHRLQQRHTLEVPKLSTSRANNNTDDVVSASGRFSPTAGGRRRGSMSLVRRTTRSVNSDVHPDEVPQDDDAARWAEHIRQKRASKRKRKEDEDEDRVVVGTKVDQHHVNWVTAYNMLTGIRFTVSRTNAKMDRDLTDADFDAKHKFSFDMYVPSGFPHLVKHLLEFSFVESGWPVLLSYAIC